ncbi:MAG TPA: methylated-DNA--[protein]-cysteine S-methyltransferase [Thermoanaerobaculia bacterium]|nr:methylated-DNA--[protein]-cysteine S-methyltransferase [Thermoanaerobaculia bacterium]
MIETLPPRPEMLRAHHARDASYDGVFYLAVKTTGIFCRPSCPARKPRPENVEFFASPREALFAGFRPCRRCRPLEATGRPPEWVAGLLSEVERDPAAPLGDAELRRRGLEPARVRRFFQKEYGMTFHAYRRARRLGGALEAIRRGDGLDDAGWDAGYESSSGFREAFAKTFGNAPGQSRDADCIRISWIESPVGPLLAGATADAVCLLEFTDRRALETQLETLRRRFDRTLVPGSNDRLDQLREELAEYFEGRRREFDVPVAAPGTPFELAVWGELRSIPYGETRSYEELARAVGRPGGSRAVGQANGRNRVAIVLPCHRVVNKSGQLGGYGGGLWRKRFLLDLEQRHSHGGQSRLIDVEGQSRHT